MFIQVLQAQCDDVPACQALLQRWRTDLEPGAIGWLGGTFGFTDDDEMVGIVRFESAEAARANSERPEQTEFWNELLQYTRGEPTVHDCTDVVMLLGDESDEGGFVQVIQGRVKDREQALAMVEGDGTMLSRERPDVLRATIAIDEDGFFTETVTFTSEADARAAEQAGVSDAAREHIKDELAMLEDVHYLDLREPMFAHRTA